MQRFISSGFSNGTVIATTSGHLSCQEIYELVNSGTWVGVAAVSNDNFEPDVVGLEYVQIGEPRPCLKLVVHSGRFEVTTPNREYLVWRGELPEWLPLGSVLPGESIAMAPSQCLFGFDAIGVERAKLLGYLQGDGGLTNSSPMFTNKDPLILDDIRQILSTEFPEVSLKHVANCSYRIAANRRGQSNSLTVWLREIGVYGKLSKHKHIPKCIRTAPRSEVAGFLNRLYACDGWVALHSTKQRSIPQVGICLASKEMVLDIQRELLRFGIIGVLRYKPSKFNDKVFDAWVFTIADCSSIVLFERHIGIFSKDQKLRLAVDIALSRTSCSLVRNNLPKGLWPRVHRLKNDQGLRNYQVAGYTAHNGGPNRLRSQYCPNRSKVLGYAESLCDAELTFWAGANLHWETISAIEDVGVQPVMSIVLEDKPILYGGILSK